MDFIKLVIIALVCEAIWETCKMAWQKGKFSWEKIGVLVVGMIISIGTGLDFFNLVSIPITIPYLGMLLTGVLISRGSNFIHSLIGTINNIYTQTK